MSNGSFFRRPDKLKTIHEGMTVIYAESFRQLLQENKLTTLFQPPSLLFVSTVDIYDQLYDSVTRHCDSSDQFQWFICPNEFKVNTLETIQKLYQFIDDMKLPTGTRLIGFGDDELANMCGYLAESHIVIKDYYFLAINFSGFVTAVSCQPSLINRSLTTTTRFLTNDKLKGLIYDASLARHLAKGNAESLSLLVLFKYALTTNKMLLKRLYQESLTKPLSLTVYCDDILRTLTNQTADFLCFGDFFTTGLYQTEGAHYLTFTQKKWLGCLLQFFWCQRQFNVKIEGNQLIEWLQWLIKESLVLPNNILSSDLSNEIYQECRRYQQIQAITALGVSNQVTIPSQESLYETIEEYRQLIKI